MDVKYLTKKVCLSCNMGSLSFRQLEELLGKSIFDKKH